MKFNSGINTIKRTLTAAEMNSAAEAITIIPAPGAGLVILSVSIYVSNKVTVAWTTDATVSTFEVGNAITIAFPAQDIFEANTGAVYSIPLDINGGGVALANSALTLTLGGSGATDGTGTVDVIVIYKVMPI